MDCPQAHLNEQIHCINQLLATEGPLPEAVEIEMLKGIEEVLRLSGYTVALHEQLLWCAYKEGEAETYCLHDSEAEMLRYAFTDLFGDPTIANQEYLGHTMERICEGWDRIPVLEH